jgi:nicotinate-nucleotide adenylyltransferase
MRLGILGGTFDPVHYGHLVLAECCREHCRLDRVLFLPAAVPPHKTTYGVSASADRVEMLKLAIGGHPQFEISTYEIDRGGVNYTFETLAAIGNDSSDAELFFLLGSDSLNDLPRWREPRRICELATLAVAQRAGSPEPNWQALAPLVSPERLEAYRACQTTMPQIGISSNDLRRRVAEGRSIRYQTTRAVEKYIETHGLYRQAEREDALGDQPISHLQARYL